jgi:hypothetical protein
MDSVNDELQRRINEHVLNGDAPSIIWAMEGQIRINTELEAKLAELESALEDARVVYNAGLEEAEEQDQRIVELERREALYEELVTGYDNADANQCADARDAIDWIERP